LPRSTPRAFLSVLPWVVPLTALIVLQVLSVSDTLLLRARHE